MLYRTGALQARLQTHAREGRACILALHRVLGEEAAAQSHSLPGMSVHEDVFRELCQFLRSEFELVKLSDLMAGSLPPSSSKPRLAVTFDDGWEDNHPFALPILEQAGIPWTLFLTTGAVGKQRAFWVEQVVAAAADHAVFATLCVRIQEVLGKKPHDLESLVEILKHCSSAKRKTVLDSVPEQFQQGSGDGMLSWQQIREMSSRGVAFGTHTVSHPLLPYETDADVMNELHDPLDHMRAQNVEPLRAFAYPNGTWDARVRQAAINAGYTHAFTTRRGWCAPEDDPFTLRRFIIHDGNITDTSGRFSPAMFLFTLIR